MAWEFAEGLVNEILTYLEANLPTKLDVIDAAINDGITLRDPVEYLRRDPSLPKLSGTLPLVFVKAPQGKVTMFKETAADQEHVLWIYVMERATDAEARVVHLEARLEECIGMDGPFSRSWLTTTSTLRPSIPGIPSERFAGIIAPN